MKYSLLFLTLITCSFAVAGYHDGDFAKNNHHFYDDQNESSETGWKGAHDFIWNDSRRTACEHCPYNNMHKLNVQNETSFNDETPKKIGKRIKNQQSFDENEYDKEPEQHNQGHKKSWLKKIKSLIGIGDFENTEPAQNEARNNDGSEREAIRINKKINKKLRHNQMYRDQDVRVAKEDYRNYVDTTRPYIATKRSFRNGY